MVDLNRNISKATMNEIESYMSDRKREQIRKELNKPTPREMIKKYLEYDNDFEDVLVNLFGFSTI